MAEGKLLGKLAAFLRRSKLIQFCFLLFWSFLIYTTTFVGKGHTSPCFACSLSYVYTLYCAKINFLMCVADATKSVLCSSLLFSIPCQSFAPCSADMSKPTCCLINPAKVSARPKLKVTAPTRSLMRHWRWEQSLSQALMNVSLVLTGIFYVCFSTGIKTWKKCLKRAF